MPLRTLVIGYGNMLRRDDGVGPLVARRLASLGVSNVVEASQLLPEHIEAVAVAEVVVLVDAAVDLPPGEVRRTSLQPAATGVPPVDLHELRPEGLVTAARELYGGTPQVWLVSVGVADVDFGERLSPTVEAALPRAVAAVLDIVAGS
jgi:hydrogenase maturation protease